MIFPQSLHNKALTLVLISLLMAACGTKAEGTPSDVSQVAGSAQAEDRCSHSLDYNYLHLESAGRVASLGDEFQLGTLGQAGALDLAGEIFSLEGSFCALPIPDEVAHALDEIGRLYESGQDALADQKLADLLASVGQEARQSPNALKLAKPHPQQGGAGARRAVRSYLAIAARAQWWGNYERGDDAINSARETFDAWASDAIENASMQEALRIAAEAQLLGLYELGDDAISRASDLAEQAFNEAMKAFKPCLASLKEARMLLRTVATAMLLGVDTGQDFMVEIEAWRDIQLRRKRGEAVPECEGGLVEWEVNSGAITFTGKVFTCDGTTWQGEYTQTLQFGPTRAEASAEFELKLAVGADSSEVRFVSEGAWTVEDEVIPFQDNIVFRMTLTDDGTTATIDMESEGGVLYVGGQPMPVPQAQPATTGILTLPVVPYGECNSES